MFQKEEFELMSHFLPLENPQQIRSEPSLGCIFFTHVLFLAPHAGLNSAGGVNAVQESQAIAVVNFAPSDLFVCVCAERYFETHRPLPEIAGKTISAQ